MGFIEKAIAKHGNKYDYSLVEYVAAKKKVKIICKIHGAFEQTADGHLNTLGCGKCSRKISYTNDEILTCHNQWVDEGYEGAMIKRPNGRYQPGQRSSHWIKVKMFDDDEFKVIGYKLGLRGVQDLIFICECEGGTFDVQMNGSIESKQELYDKIDSLIGQDLTCKFFGYTPYGIPNLAKGKAFRERE